MKKFVFASILAVPALAMAQATPVGPFTGDLQEGFDLLPGGFLPSHPVFEGTAEVISLGGSMHTTTGWSFMCSIFPYEGTRLAASASGAARYEFSDDVGAFGGYFGTNAEVAGFDAFVRFYDASGGIIAEDTIAVPADCTWDWAGWEFDTSVTAIEIESPVFGGGYVMMDAMQLTYGGSTCRVDLDGDGSLTLFDFLAFQNAFDSGDLIADFDGDGSLTLFDFLAFQNEFDAGCE